MLKTVDIEYMPTTHRIAKILIYTMKVEERNLMVMKFAKCDRDPTTLTPEIEDMKKDAKVSEVLARSVCEGLSRTDDLSEEVIFNDLPKTSSNLAGLDVNVDIDVDAVCSEVSLQDHDS